MEKKLNKIQDKKLYNDEKNRTNEKATQYYSHICKVINDTNDENILNFMFTETTILRIELDHHDNLITNIKEHFNREKIIDKKELIKLQFKDILDSLLKYSFEEEKKVDELIKKINQRVDISEEKSWLERIWEDICQGMNAMHQKK